MKKISSYIKLSGIKFLNSLRKKEWLLLVAILISAPEILGAVAAGRKVFAPQPGVGFLFSLNQWLLVIAFILAIIFSLIVMRERYYRERNRNSRKKKSNDDENI
jgi:hypothetical protein